jgi:hypothetical protein
MSDDIVERIARRIRFEYVDSHGYPNGFVHWDDMTPLERELWRGMALSAISMMMEPTDEMIWAGGTALHDHQQDTLGIWQAMIGAALKDSVTVVVPDEQKTL